MDAQGTGGAGAKAPVPTGHSRFGASGADRWIECPGSVKAQEGCPNETSSYAAEGTAGHEVAALCLESGQDAIEFVGRFFEVKDYPERIEIDDEIAEGVQVFLDAIRTDKETRGGKIVIERRFHLDWLHEEFWGTTDCGRLGHDNVLCVYDLKLGKGKPVEVEGNRQLCYYALGMIASLPKSLKIDKVELVLVQPRRPHRDGPVRRWTTTPTDLLDYCQDLVDAAANALSPDPTFKAGDHCGFCRAAATCKTLREFAMDTAQLDFDDNDGIVQKHGELTPNPLEMSYEHIAHVLDAADVIETWLSVVRQHAEGLANAGIDIPGYKLVDKRAVRKWVVEDPEKMAEILCFDFGLDESSIFAKKIKSPAQIEKLLPKDEKPALANHFDKKSSGKKLARLSDPRDEVASTAQSDFD